MACHGQRLREPVWLARSKGRRVSGLAGERIGTDTLLMCRFFRGESRRNGSRLCVGRLGRSKVYGATRRVEATKRAQKSRDAKGKSLKDANCANPTPSTRRALKRARIRSTDAGKAARRLKGSRYKAKLHGPNGARVSRMGCPFECTGYRPIRSRPTIRTVGRGSPTA